MMSKVSRSNFKRARSETEKRDRREAMITTARTYVQDKGIDGFTMSGLAKAAGVAKGTLYLYFATKEELLLSLYCEQLSQWSRRLKAGCHPGISDKEFCDIFLAAAQTDQLFLGLSGRLSSTIEKNVSLDCLVEAKRTMRDIIGPVAQHIETCLQLSSGNGLRLVTVLTALLVGSIQLGSDPQFLEVDLPDDVANIIAAFSCASVFNDSAVLVLIGLRNQLEG